MTGISAADPWEVDRIVARVLSAFDLTALEHNARWRGHLNELRKIVTADYHGAVDTFYRSGRLPVRSMLRDAAQHFPDFCVRALRFDAVAREQISGLGISLRLQHYPRRPPLRAFYHSERNCGPIIWVNLAHPPGAVAASLGHELGHWYRERLLGAPAVGTSVPFFNADFATHLQRPDELFADVFPVLAAYPTPTAQRIFGPQRLRRTLAALSELDVQTLQRVRTHLKSNYGFDAPARPDLGIPRQISYVASMVHFARLRSALLRVVGV